MLIAAIYGACLSIGCLKDPVLDITCKLTHLVDDSYYTFVSTKVQHSKWAFAKKHRVKRRIHFKFTIKDFKLIVGAYSKKSSMYLMSESGEQLVSIDTNTNTLKLKNEFAFEWNDESEGMGTAPMYSLTCGPNMVKDYNVKFTMSCYTYPNGFKGKRTNYEKVVMEDGQPKSYGDLNFYMTKEGEFSLTQPNSEINYLYQPQYEVDWNKLYLLKPIEYGTIRCNTYQTNDEFVDVPLTLVCKRTGIKEETVHVDNGHAGSLQAPFMHLLFKVQKSGKYKLQVTSKYSSEILENADLKIENNKLELKAQLEFLYQYTAVYGRYWNLFQYRIVCKTGSLGFTNVEMELPEIEYEAAKKYLPLSREAKVEAEKEIDMKNVKKNFAFKRI